MFLIFFAQIIFRFALSLFKYKEEEFLKLQDSTTLFKYLRYFTRTILDSRYRNMLLALDWLDIRDQMFIRNLCFSPPGSWWILRSWTWTHFPWGRSRTGGPSIWRKSVLSWLSWRQSDRRFSGRERPVKTGGASSATTKRITENSGRNSGEIVATEPNGSHKGIFFGTSSCQTANIGVKSHQKAKTVQPYGLSFIIPAIFYRFYLLYACIQIPLRI